MAAQSGTSGQPAVKPRVRGKWTAQQREEIVVATLTAGTTVNEVAERYGVRAALISAWRRKHARATGVASASTKPARFAAVRVRSATTTDGIIEIDLASGCVRVRGIVDVQMLREVLAATR
jgi:transposase-like protein